MAEPRSDTGFIFLPFRNSRDHVIYFQAEPRRKRLYLAGGMPLQLLLNRSEIGRGKVWTNETESSQTSRTGAVQCCRDYDLQIRSKQDRRLRWRSCVRSQREPRVGVIGENMKGNELYVDKESSYYGFVRRDILDLIPKTAKHLLDVGCGTGDTGMAAYS